MKSIKELIANLKKMFRIWKNGEPKVYSGRNYTFNGKFLQWEAWGELEVEFLDSKVDELKTLKGLELMTAIMQLEKFKVLNK